MIETALARAQAGAGEAFRELVEPYRDELQAHCYRMLGSVADAEDVLQEALLAAWRSIGRFDGRALRTMFRTSCGSMISDTPSRRCSMPAASRSGKSPRCSDSPAPARPNATFTGSPTSSWPGLPVSRSITLFPPAGQRRPGR
jgi:hypothetical protein